MLINRNIKITIKRCLFCIRGNFLQTKGLFLSVHRLKGEVQWERVSSQTTDKQKRRSACSGYLTTCMSNKRKAEILNIDLQSCQHF